MKKTTEPYITLRDREWKGKEWFTSYGSHLNIRKLTDEEAEPLLSEGTVQKIIPKPAFEEILGVNDGRMFCLKCGSNKGFYIKKRPFGKKINIFTCADCGRREKREVK